MENYYTYRAKVDIGIVPCFMPERIKPRWFKLPLSKRFNRLNKSDDDYLLRFKMPTNPGRIIVWGLLNVPVVSDFFPSAMQCIEDGKDGLLAYSEGGWYRALEKFIKNPLLRQTCADNLTNYIEHRYSFSMQNRKFEEFLESQLNIEGNSRS
jgi:glycosyltransferase involved in cell wall biosynthesis